MANNFLTHSNRTLLHGAQYESKNEATLNLEDCADLQERKLRQAIKEALRENDICSNDELSDVVAALKRLGVKTTKHFRLLKTEDLRSEGIPIVTARILMVQFGPASEAFPNVNKADGFWKTVSKFVESQNFPVLLSFLNNIIRTFCEAAKRNKDDKDAVNSCSC
ncbi:uncharacterized protein LOC144106739 [Amblyomma americanum]